MKKCPHLYWKIIDLVIWIVQYNIIAKNCRNSEREYPKGWISGNYTSSQCHFTHIPHKKLIIDDHGTKTQPHPPYNPDLVPCDFFVQVQKVSARKAVATSEEPIMTCLIKFLFQWLKCFPFTSKYFQFLLNVFQFLIELKDIYLCPVTRRQQDCNQ